MGTENYWAILNVEIVGLHLLQMTSFEQACVLHIMTMVQSLSLPWSLHGH